MMCAQNLQSDNIDYVARDWGKRMSCAAPRWSPDRLYCGRSFCEGRSAARCLDANLYVISAGYGFVSPGDKVAPYCLTVVSDHVDFVGRKISATQWSPNAWWRALGANTDVNTSLRTILEKEKPDLILMALSISYAHLIVDELRDLTSEFKTRLRVFCVGETSGVLSIIENNVMPYDNRFDGPDSPIRGTKSDFSCRALHHYAQCLRDGLIQGESLAEDKVELASVMADWKSPEKQSRKRQTDEEIMAFISDIWDKTSGRSSISLRQLRDSGRSCEQGRFSKLFRKVALQRKPH